MKVEIKYTGSILNLPASVSDIAPEAGALELKVILTLAKYAHCFSCLESAFPKMCEALGADEGEIRDALSFWAKNGVITLEGVDDGCAMSTASGDSPAYTGKQIEAFINKNEGVKALFSACETVLGKSFTTHDYNNVINLKDYYRFSDEYILLLLAHCVESEKSGWAYIRKVAASLYDEGINTYEALEAHFCARKNKRTLEYKLRKLFGIGQRELTKTEKNYFEKITAVKMSYELILLAYDVTVEKTGKVPYAYLVKILENWSALGIKTKEEAEKSLEEYKSKGNVRMSSFDTNDFFEAALNRSNEEMKKRRGK